MITISCDRCKERMNSEEEIGIQLEGNSYELCNKCYSIIRKEIFEHNKKEKNNKWAQQINYLM